MAARPAIAQLQQYDIVFTFSNNVWADSVAMGNVPLADYEDGGGVVVVRNHAWANTAAGFCREGG